MSNGDAWRNPLIGLLAVSIMATAAYDVGAQQDDEARPQQPPRRTPSRPVPLRPPVRSPSADRGTPPPAPRRTRPAETPAAEEEEEEQIKEFESGVEFEPLSPRTRVTFNLEEADLPELVRLISNMTGRRFILPGKLRAIKATVYAPTEVTVAEAYNAFLAVLEVNGLNVVRAGPYLKIVELGNIESQALPIFSDGQPTPASERFVTRLHHLGNVSADDVTTLLTRFKSPEGNVTAYAPTNMLILTDTGAQVRRMLRLIEAVDVPRGGTQTWIEPVHYADASELAARLLEIFPAEAATTTPTTRRRQPQQRGGGDRAAARGRNAAPATVGAPSGDATIRNIIADIRTNSLIIISTERAYLRILEMIRQLDVPLEGEGKIHVHFIQHGAATDIADALTALVGGGRRRPTTAGRGQQARAAQPAAAQATLFEGDVSVTAYEPTNALVITSSLHDYSSLKRVIERLDAPRRQVFIEAVVMELGVERTSDLGLAFHGGAGDFPTDGSLSLFGFNAPSSIDITQNNLTGLVLGVRGPTIENSQQLVGFSVPGFGAVVTALATSGDADVLSTPHIIAIDNVEAEISVGENIPLQTNGVAPGTFAGLGALGGIGVADQGGQDLGNLAGLAGGFGSVARQDVGTTIRITPHINEDNEVRLEIQEEISEQGATSGTLGVVSINRRTARTEVMVRDQQTIVIGGLMRDTVSNQEDKIPVLGDIPILGALFRRTNKQKRKTNLLLILTPYIIRDPGDLRSIFERKMQERQTMIDRYFVFGEDEFEPHIDYSRTRGLVSEIANEIDAVEEEIRLAEAAKLIPAPDHAPREPVGPYRAPPEEAILIGPNGEERLFDEGEDQSGPPPAPDEGEEGSDDDALPVESESQAEQPELEEVEGTDEQVPAEEPDEPTLEDQPEELPPPQGEPPTEGPATEE